MGSLSAQENDSIIKFGAEINAGELFSFENKSIQFKKVITDSRCPKDVTCIWAGEAKVLIAIMENGKQVEEKIITLTGGADITSLANGKDFTLSFSDSKEHYSLNALNLYPYPTSTHKIKDSEYCLFIQLSKTK
jgi:D-arabinose 5-phosphate isomerase GutQ